MALVRRPASRFFAAFYRWSRYSQQPHQCTISSSYSRRIPSGPACTRKYHASRLLRQQQAQDEETHKKLESSFDADHEYKDNEMKKAEPISVQKVLKASQSGASTDEAIPPQAEEADDDAEQLRNDVRNLMRKVPSSVAIVTVASVDAELNKHVPMGVAVSSLSTVSLDPPTISFNIKHPSKTLDSIRAAKGLFRVHFPVADRGGASMVDLFCRGNHADAYTARRRDLRIFVPGIDFREDKLRASASNAPQIFGDSLRAAMECTLTHEFEVGDHVILVARVDHVESKISDDRTILYVDGMYMRPDGTKVVPNGKVAVAAHDKWSAWDYPLFPGDAERRDYMERIKTMVKNNPGFFQDSTYSAETIQEVQRTLTVNPGALGISLRKLIDDVRQESGKPSDLSPHWKHLSPLSEFYGRLTPSDMTRIHERVKNFVKEDTHFLSLNYRMFLQHLGVSTSSIGLLPSDILESLRDARLVGPFQPRTGGPNSDTREFNIQYLEQVERRIIEHLATLGYEKVMKTRLEDVVLSLGEQKSIASYFKKSRSRLLIKAFPHLFTTSEMDISGHVSQEEARVVMSRIVEFLRLGNFRKSINLDSVEMLRQNRIHPSITGLDVEFFLGKLKHLYYSTRQSRDVPGRVDEMLKPWFADTITWADLEARVKEFVQETPSRAMSWSNRDKLAFMGLRWKSTLTVPVSKTSQPLNRGHILDTLVAKELKSMYRKSTPDLDEAIARHLQEQYSFDIKAESSQPLSASDARTSSSYDEVQGAMLASRHVNVTADKRKHASLSHDEKEAGAGVGAGPRIHSTSPRSSRNTTKRPTEKAVEKDWTSYSLTGARKFE